jgi:hypothetical protein
MDAIKNLIENLKERIKTAWSEQQESEIYLKTKEKYDELPPLVQKGIMGGISLLFLLLIFWWPLSNFFDSSDFNSKFDDERQTLKELIRIERETTVGSLTNPPSPSSLKTQFDSKIANAGIKTDQVKDQSEMPMQLVGLAEQHGFQYRITHITIRQAVDLGYELEHVDPSLHIGGLEVTAEPQDPHFYDVGIKIVNFAPKIADLGSPGKGIADAIKKKTEGAKPE